MPSQNIGGAARACEIYICNNEYAKVPVTVLSRCQRFDLKRVRPEDLSAHLKHIADQEDITTEAGALQLVMTFDGSVRDALSLLDQTIVYGAGQVTQSCVLEMIGLANREDILTLLDSVFSADLKGTFERLAQLYEAGADPVTIISDLQDYVHKITLLKAVPDLPSSHLFAARNISIQEADMRNTFLWLFSHARGICLLRSKDEIRLSSHPLRALEMGLLRLAYATDVPAAKSSRTYGHRFGRKKWPHHPRLLRKSRRLTSVR